MNNREDILNELAALSSTLMAIPRQNVFTVPANYFNSLSDNVLELVKAENPACFHPIHSPSYSVPEGYFEGLAESILGKIKTGQAESPEGEIQHLSPVIAAIGRQNILSVPDGYFETNTAVIMARIPVPAKVISIKKRPTLIRYMAAAVITGIIGISVFSVFNKKTGGEDLLPQANEFVMAQADEIIRNKSFEKELENISDKDIEQYLLQNGQDVNAALVASVTDDEYILPDKEDYLINENTLDEFLNKMNLDN